MEKFATYDEAKRWMASLGGTISGPSAWTQGYDKVEGAIGQMRASCGISVGTTGPQRQKDLEDAVVWVANELYRKGAEEMIKAR